MDFKNLKKKEIVSPKLTLKLEIDLLESSLTEDEAARNVQLCIDSSRSKEFSNLVVFLLRETRSSMWDLKKLEITSKEEEEK